MERDALIRDPIFARFLRANDLTPDTSNTVTPPQESVYLICTSAGEVGIDMSADHLVCDLTPFDSMAQRFGRFIAITAVMLTWISLLRPKKKTVLARGSVKKARSMNARKS